MPNPSAESLRKAGASKVTNLKAGYTRGSSFGDDSNLRESPPTAAAPAPPAAEPAEPSAQGRKEKSAASARTNRSIRMTDAEMLEVRRFANRLELRINDRGGIRRVETSDVIRVCVKIATRMMEEDPEGIVDEYLASEGA